MITKNRILKILFRYIFHFLFIKLFSCKIFYVTIIIFSILNVSCSQTTDPKIEEGNLISLSQTSPQFSSDGQKIVFEGLYDSVYAVHFVDIAGNYFGYILDRKGFLSSPTWSPNDEKIAVTIEGNLYTVKVNGDSLMMLTNTGEDFLVTGLQTANT